jgi:inner membrane protein
LRRYAHILFGVGFSLFALSPFLYISQLPIMIMASGIGSIAPDLDTRFRHRKALHNILSLAVASILALTVVLITKIGLLPAASFTLGYISHIIGDMMTVRGVALLYPFKRKHYRFPITLGRSEDPLVNILGAALGIAMMFLGLRVFF